MRTMDYGNAVSFTQRFCAEWKQTLMHCSMPDVGRCALLLDHINGFMRNIIIMRLKTLKHFYYPGLNVGDMFKTTQISSLASADN